VALRVHTYRSYTELSAATDALFADVRGSLFHSRAWLENAERNGLRPGDQLRLFAVEADGNDAPVALLPAIYSRLYASHPGARVLHFLQPEEQPYEPLAANRKGDVADAVRSIIAALQQKPNAYDVVRVGPLDPGSPFTREVIAALRRMHYPLQTYHQLSDWYETVGGTSFREYFARRPRLLRESLDRNTHLLLQGGRGRFNFSCTRELLDNAWDSIQYVLAAAPVEGEPDPPGYLRSIMTLAADTGTLRLGLFYLDDLPVAMQLWVVTAGVARCLRIWSAQGQRAFPIDDVLTQMMAVCLIDGDHVAELDFGGITQEFARDWAPKARQRIAVAAFNPRTWRGLRGAARHIGVQMLKSLPSRLWRRMRGA
jgi:hypothetical protein